MRKMQNMAIFARIENAIVELKSDPQKKVRSNQQVPWMPNVRGYLTWNVLNPGTTQERSSKTIRNGWKLRAKNKPCGETVIQNEGFKQLKENILKSDNWQPDYNVPIETKVQPSFTEIFGNLLASEWKKESHWRDPKYTTKAKSNWLKRECHEGLFWFWRILEFFLWLPKGSHRTISLW